MISSYLGLVFHEVKTYNLNIFSIYDSAVFRRLILCVFYPPIFTVSHFAKNFSLQNFVSYGILFIRQNFIRQSLLRAISPKISPSKILYRTVLVTGSCKGTITSLWSKKVRFQMAGIYRIYNPQALSSILTLLGRHNPRPLG